MDCGEPMGGGVGWGSARPAPQPWPGEGAVNSAAVRRRGGVPPPASPPAAARRISGSLFGAC